eukprot:5707624-Pyramimonas_sp.AAC.1
MAPSEVEMAVCRLGMYQGWAKGPESSGQLLYSLFGEMPADAHRPQLVSGLPSAFSSPCVRQVHPDVGWASGILDAEFLDELHRDLRLLRDR